MTKTTNGIQKAVEDPDQASFKICDDRVLVFHRADSPNWFSLWRTAEGEQIQQSLRTKDRTIAAERAAKAHMEFEFRIKHNLSVRTTTFEHACDIYLVELREMLEKKGKSLERLRDTRGRIERYLKPFFADKPIDTISSIDIVRYRDWRERYWTTGPGSQVTGITYVRNGRTIRSPMGRRVTSDGMKTLPEDVTLRAIFACACKHGWMAQGRIPLIKTAKIKDNSRPCFMAEEADRLLRTGCSWTEEAATPEARAIRSLTVDFIGLLLATGMRPSEAAGLRWGDLDYFQGNDGHRNLRIWVAAATKTGKREVIAHARAEAIVLGMGLDRAAERRQGVEWLFATPEGRRITDFSRPFGRWLEFAGLTRNARGEKRTIYSCRHTYITEALMAGHSTHLVAINTGTSTQMIDRFYSKVSPSMNASRLSGRVTS